MRGSTMYSAHTQIARITGGERAFEHATNRAVVIDNEDRSAHLAKVRNGVAMRPEIRSGRTFG